MTAIQRNIGGGNEGEGGPLGDAASLDTTNRNDNRTQADYGIRPTVSEELPITPPTTSTAEDFSTSQYSFQTELDNSILAHSLDNNGEGTVNIQIAKPPELRVSIYERTLADGTVITKESAGRRKLLKGTLERFEVIDRAYIKGDLIYAVVTPASGVSGVTLLDLNIDARRWINEEPTEQWFIVIEVNKDTLECRVWDWATGAAVLPDPFEEDPGTITVAKPVDIRGSEWVGLTLAGVAYTSTDGTTETDGHTTRQGIGTVTEQQEIIPPYLEGVIIGSKIKATRCDVGTGAFRNGIEALWQEHGARAFSEIAT